MSGTSFYEQLDGKRKLFFLTNKGCPLDWYARLTYSLLVSRRPYSAALSMREVSRLGNLSRPGVRAAVARLTESGVVEADAQERYLACPPPDNWFAVRNPAAEEWWQRLAYFPLWLPVARKDTIDFAVYFLLRSLAQGGPCARRQCDAGLGKMLGLCPRTIDRALARLEKEGWIKAFRRRGRHAGFDAILPDVDDKFFGRLQDKERPPAAEADEGDMAGGSAGACNATAQRRAAEPRCRRKAKPEATAVPSSGCSSRFAEQMRDHGIADKLIAEAERLALEIAEHDETFAVFGFTDLLNEAQAAHDKTGHAAHCGYLLVSKLKALAGKYQGRIREADEQFQRLAEQCEAKNRMLKRLEPFGYMKDVPCPQCGVPCDRADTSDLFDDAALDEARRLSVTLQDAVPTLRVTPSKAVTFCRECRAHMQRPILRATLTVEDSPTLLYFELPGAKAVPFSKAANQPQMAGKAGLWTEDEFLRSLDAA